MPRRRRSNNRTETARPLFNVLNDPAFTVAVNEAAAAYLADTSSSNDRLRERLSQASFQGSFILEYNGEPINSLEDFEERRQEQTTMATRVKEENVGTILLETGQDQQRQASNLLFFVYVTPTGAEISIGKCPTLRRSWGRTEGGFDGSTRVQRSEFQVLSPTTIKMVNICTIFGSPKRTVNLFIDLDPSQASIELTGLEGFGLFKGRGKVNLKRSYYREHTDHSSFTNEMLKNLFNFKILQPPRMGASKKVRSLIY